MTDYAESITEINRLKREIHDACLAGEWWKAMVLSDQLESNAHQLRNYCSDQAMTNFSAEALKALNKDAFVLCKKVSHSEVEEMFGKGDATQ